MHSAIDKSSYKQALGDVLRQLKEMPGCSLEWEWMKDEPPGEGQFIEREAIEEWLIAKLTSL